MHRYPAVSEWIPVEDDGVRFLVRRCGIPTTPVVYYRVYEADDADHTTVAHDSSGTRVGTVMSRSLSAMVGDLEDGPEAVDQVLHGRRLLCHRLIRAAFPDVMERRDAQLRNGDVYTRENERVDA